MGRGGGAERERMSSLETQRRAGVSWGWGVGLSGVRRRWEGRGGEGRGAGGEADVVEFIPVQRVGFIDDGCAVAFVSEA